MRKRRNKGVLKVHLEVSHRDGEEGFIVPGLNKVVIA
jgi:hypothetical protein